MSGRIRLQANQLLLPGYLLLWPALLTLLLRTAANAAFFGLWSGRVFALIVVIVMAISAATALIIPAVRRSKVSAWLEYRIAALRQRRLLHWGTVALVLVGWVVLNGIIAWRGVSIEPTVLVGLVDAGSFVLLLIIAVTYVGGPVEAGQQAARDVQKERLVDGLLLGHLGYLLCLISVVTLTNPHAIRAGSVPVYAALGTLTAITLALTASLTAGTFSTRGRVALLAVSSTFALSCCEIGVRAFGPPNDVYEFRQTRLGQRAAQAKQQGVDFDTRSNVQVILDLRESGIPALPSGNFETYLGERGGHAQRRTSRDPGRSVIEVNGIETLPLGHPPASTLVGVENENGYYSVFRTDRYGFRNPDELWGSQVDVVAVGDSFTEGCEVHDGQSFVSRIRERIPRTVNLGLGGGGPFTMLACLREYGAILKPKVVLWCFYEGNDLDNFMARRHAPILANYLNQGYTQNLADRREAVGDAVHQYLESAVRRLQDHSSDSPNVASRLWNVMDAATLNRTRAMLGLVPNSMFQPSMFSAPTSMHWSTTARDMDRNDFALFRSVIKAAKAETESWGGRLRFVYLPSYYRCAAPSFVEQALKPDSTDTDNDPRFEILLAVKQLGIEVIDVTVAFAAHPDPLSLFPFRHFGHFNADGHQHTADVICEKLQVRGESMP